MMWGGGAVGDSEDVGGLLGGIVVSKRGKVPQFNNKRFGDATCTLGM